MPTLIQFGQVFFSILILVLILIQSQGTGLGSAWAGGGETYHTKRGVEKIVFYLTIGSVIIFAGLSLLALMGFK